MIHDRKNLSFISFSLVSKFRQYKTVRPGALSNDFRAGWRTLRVRESLGLLLTLCASDQGEEQTNVSIVWKNFKINAHDNDFHGLQWFHVERRRNAKEWNGKSLKEWIRTSHQQLGISSRRAVAHSQLQVFIACVNAKNEHHSAVFLSSPKFKLLQTTANNNNNKKTMTRKNNQHEELRRHVNLPHTVDHSRSIAIRCDS